MLFALSPPSPVEQEDAQERMHHTIDRRGAAQYLAPGPVAGPAVKARLGLGFITPVDSPVEKSLAVSDGGLDPEPAVTSAGFQQ